MKKFFAFLLAFAMMFSLCGVATADTITGDGSITDGKRDNDVTIIVEGVASAATVYKVDITWNGLTFTYNFNEGTKTWDTTNHEYNTDTGDGITGWDGGDTKTITITNHSNAAISYTASFASDSIKNMTENTNGVYAKLNKTSGSVVTADNALYNGTTDAPADFFTVTVVGTPTKANNAAGFTVGTIYIVISH